MKGLFRIITAPFRLFKRINASVFFVLMGVICVWVLLLRAGLFTPSIPEDWKAIINENTVLQLSDGSDEEPEKTAVLSAGSEVFVLGYDVSAALLWVQTANGERGLIPYDAVEKELLVIETIGGKHEISVGENLIFVSRDDKEHVITAVTADGTQIQLKRTDFDNAVPVMAADKLKYSYLGHRVPCLMTEKTADKKLIGMTLANIEKRIAPARYIRNENGSSIAQLQMRVFDRTTRTFAVPCVVVTDGKVSSVEYINRSSWSGKYSIKTWLLAKMPGGGMAVDLLRFTVQEPIYDIFNSDSMVVRMIRNGWIEKVNPDKIPTALVVILALLFLFFSYVIPLAAYYWFTPLIIVILLYILLHRPWPLKFVSNLVMIFVVLGLLIVGCYLWLLKVCVLLNSSLLVVTAGVVLLAVKLGAMSLDLIDRRCVDCKHIDSYELDHTDYGQPRQEWRFETESHLLDTHTVEKGGWVTALVPSSIGYDKKRVRKETVTVTRTRHDKYKVLYLIEPYVAYFKCKYCGTIRRSSGENLTVLEKIDLGSGISTVTETTKYK